jgi:hypothetical protein
MPETRQQIIKALCSGPEREVYVGPEDHLLTLYQESGCASTCSLDDYIQAAVKLNHGSLHFQLGKKVILPWSEAQT